MILRLTIYFFCTFLYISVTSSCKKNKSTLAKETSFSQGEIHNSIDGSNGEVVSELASSELNSNGSNQTKENADLVKKSKQQAFANEEFPIIFFGMINTDRAFELAKKWGATHVHSYGLGKSKKRDQNFFDRAAEYELKVMANLGGRYWIKQNNGVDSMRALVRHFKDHPALGFWYLFDEPDNKGFQPAELKPFYRMIHEETPNIPVAISHARSKHWYRYGQVQDMFLYNNYPVEGEEFPQSELNVWTNFAKAAMKREEKDNNIVIPVLQMFNWRAFAKKSQKKFRGFAIEKLRYPNQQELRYMSFASIALGSPGLSFFSYYRARTPRKNWPGHVLAPVLQEVKKFSNHITETKMQQITGGKNNLFLTQWVDEQSAYILLANASPNSRTIRQSLDNNLETGQLEPWGKTRKAKAALEGGRIIVEQVKPWEVLIWKVQ